MPTRQRDHERDRHHVVIIGAGFAGLATAQALRSADVDVTVVDQYTFQTFQPLLYQVATAGLDADAVAHPVRAFLRGRRAQRFHQGRVRDLDLDARRVRMADGSSLRYDSLVLAVGAVYGDLGIPGVRRHAFALKSLHETLALRAHVLRQLEEASRRPDDDALRTFVVAGAGPTGVEMAGALVELLQVARREASELRDRPTRVVLVEPTDRVLADYHRSSRDHAERVLRARGVELRLGTAVVRADAGSVELSDGETLATRTLVWAAGVRAHPLAQRLGVELERGWRVSVGPDLALEGRPEVFVAGDLAGGVGGHAPQPQVAQAAIQMGQHVGRVIRARLAGRDAPAFRYRDRGQMAIVGRGSGVAELAPRLGGARFRGGLGWLAWLLVHLVYLPGRRSRISALAAWVDGLLTGERPARVPLAVERADDDSGWATPLTPADAAAPRLRRAA